MNSLLFTLLIGAAAGWIAGQFRKGSGFGLFGNLVVGIAGAFVGRILFRTLDLVGWFGGFDALATATIGAFVLLFLLDIVKNLRR